MHCEQLYYHGEPISVNVHVTNNSTKTVKRVKISGLSVSPTCLSVCVWADRIQVSWNVSHVEKVRYESIICVDYNIQTDTSLLSSLWILVKTVHAFILTAEEADLHFLLWVYSSESWGWNLPCFRPVFCLSPCCLSPVFSLHLFWSDVFPVGCVRAHAALSLQCVSMLTSASSVLPSINVQWPNWRQSKFTWASSGDLNQTFSVTSDSD